MGLKGVFFVIFIGVSVLSLRAQELTEERSDEDLIIDSFFETDEEQEVENLLQTLFKEQKDLNDLIENFSDFRFLYLSFNYNSDTYFAGRDIGINDYNVRPQITYLNSHGFFAGISGAYYKQLEPKWDFTSLSVGYGKSFGKNNAFRFSGSYTRFIYSLTDSNPYTNSVSIGLNLRNKKRTLGTRVSLTESFGSDANFQITTSLYGMISLLDKDRYRLQLRPRAYVFMGQQLAYYETDETEILPDENGEDQEYIVFKEKQIFDLMNFQINIPILFTTEKWDVELGFNRNFPFEVGDESDQRNTNFINISIGYLLEL
ncbi:hypothetical protein [Ochrovirga pacifica]|uniref:hypothetical protein n=1 Tax=Ochrovirga pacifica TaxID=1042376 RepID=UPI0002559B34|nr:hypothetical protein [Ochrovirga pacifica]